MRAMSEWIELANEVFVVDSHSTDGSLDFLRENIKHSRVKFIQRDRGLYQSWNEGIANTSGRWVYISTAGDTIERSHLEHLIEVGERLGADVVLSEPEFAREDGQIEPRMLWPVGELVRILKISSPVLLNSEMAQYFAFRFCPRALLGSSASNLYRGDHLRMRPFPSEFGGAGDAGWIMAVAHETRVSITPEVGSMFRLHAKDISSSVPLDLFRTMVEHGYSSLRMKGAIGRPLLAFEGEVKLDIRCNFLWAKRRETRRSNVLSLAIFLHLAWLHWLYLLNRSILAGIRIKNNFIPFKFSVYIKSPKGNIKSESASIP
jgi:glycosyltransferase involved in cell wall biosynthesis